MRYSNLAILFLVISLLSALTVCGCSNKEELSDQSRAEQVKAFHGDPSKAPPEYQHPYTPTSAAPPQAAPSAAATPQAAPPK